MAEVGSEGNLPIQAQREAASRGDIRTPAGQKGFNVHEMAVRENLPGEFHAKQLAGFVQRVAAEAARTGKVPTTDEWMDESRYMNRGIWSMTSEYGDPSGQQNTVVKFQKLFLAELTGQDPTWPKPPKLGKR